METESFYLKVRVVVEYDPKVHKDTEEMLNEVSSELDYKMQFNHKSVRITETEIVGINE
jgi:uncharacterized alkaline shock family protein YloU